jgi:F0F1-type ATP synthase assembly protein I
MPVVPTDTIESRVARQLNPHGSEGARAALSGVVDLEALEERRYEEVLSAVDDRLSQARYSLLSMLVAGIYFGLLVGFWLVDGSTWSAIALWGVPVLLVTTYGAYAAHQTVLQIRHLSQARALLRLLKDGAPANSEPDDT